MIALLLIPLALGAAACFIGAVKEGQKNDGR